MLFEDKGLLSGAECQGSSIHEVVWDPAPECQKASQTVMAEATGTSNAVRVQLNLLEALLELHEILPVYALSAELNKHVFAPACPSTLNQIRTKSMPGRHPCIQDNQ